jgi:hypothetical protein
MDAATIATIVGWFAQPAGQAIFTVAQNYVQQRLGLNSSSSPTSQVEPLLDKYLQQLIARLDEDRIAKLHGAFSKLKDAARSLNKQSLLNSALGDFHEVARIPEEGTTGNRPNAELRCMAFIGMVASYTLLRDRTELIEEKMIEAVAADAATAERWLGRDLVREILARLPIVACPQCGFQNPAGSLFCSRDGYPLTLDRRPSLPSPQTSTLVVARLSAFTGSLGALQINLDGKEIGPIRNGESRAFEVQAGHHIIFLRVIWVSSPSLSFDIASGEQVTFHCQMKPGLWTQSILLWKA